MEESDVIFRFVDVEKADFLHNSVNAIPGYSVECDEFLNLSITRPKVKTSEVIRHIYYPAEKHGFKKVSYEYEIPQDFKDIAELFYRNMYKAKGIPWSEFPQELLTRLDGIKYFVGIKEW